MKLKYFLAILAIFSIFSIPVSALSDEQSGAISQHCASVKQSLKTLQRTDARTRSYLGISYEKFLSDFISPLNLRLLNTNQPSSNLTEIHSDLINKRQQFVSKYTIYAQSLEELINADCQTNPEDFYKKLENTRTNRKNLDTNVSEIRTLLERHRAAVNSLRNQIWSGQ